MNSSQFATSSSEEEFLTPTPMTNLLFSRSLETRGEKSLSPEAITKVSMCSLEYDRSMASTTMRISAEFLPLYDRRGISISSMAASWKPRLYSVYFSQSAYARFTMILPFSTSRSRTRPTSNVLYLASRAPRAIFSKSMKRASLRSSFICLPYARRKPRRLVPARGLSHSPPATISITNKSSIPLKDTSSRLARPDLPHGEDSAGASRGPLYARHTNKESRPLGRDPTQIRQVFDPPPVGGQDCKMRAEVCGWAVIEAEGVHADPASGAFFHQEFGRLPAEAGEVHDPLIVHVSVGCLIARSTLPSAPHQHRRPSGNPSMFLFPRPDILHPHLGIRVPPHPAPDVDDNCGDHQAFLGDLGGRPALRAEMKRGVHMGPTVLMDVPGIGKETVARVVVGVAHLDGRVPRPARKFRAEGLSEINHMREPQGPRLAIGGGPPSNGGGAHPPPAQRRRGKGAGSPGCSPPGEGPPGGVRPWFPPPAARGGPPPLSAMSLGACRRRLGSTVVGREAEGGADPQPSGPALPRLTKRHYQVRRTRYEILTPLSLGIFTGKARVWASPFSYA